MPVSIADIGRTIHVQGQGTVFLIEFMPELEIGTVDIEPACISRGLVRRSIDRRSMVVDGRRIGRAVGRAVLKSGIRTENKGVIAVYLLLQVQVNTVILLSLDTGRSSRLSVGVILICLALYGFYTAVLLLNSHVLPVK